MVDNRKTTSFSLQRRGRATGGLLRRRSKRCYHFFTAL